MQSPGPKTNLDIERLAAMLPGDLSGDTESLWKRLCIQQDLLEPKRAQALRASLCRPLPSLVGPRGWSDAVGERIVLCFVALRRAAGAAGGGFPGASAKF